MAVFATNCKDHEWQIVGAAIRDGKTPVLVKLRLVALFALSSVSLGPSRSVADTVGPPLDKLDAQLTLVLGLLWSFWLVPRQIAAVLRETASNGQWRETWIWALFLWTLSLVAACILCAGLICSWLYARVPHWDRNGVEECN